MGQYVGIDVWLEQSSVCVTDRPGRFLRETKVASDPDALTTLFEGLDCPVTLAGLEAGPLSQWLHSGLHRAGIEAVLMETRQVKGALKAMPVKTDRRDAEEIAHLLRMGSFRPVHCRSASARELRALLTARKLPIKTMIDMEIGLRRVLHGFGLMMGKVSRGRFEASVLKLISGNPMPEHAARECQVFCLWLIGSMLPERSKDDDDFQRTAEGLQAA